MTPARELATWTVLGAGTILPRAGYGCAGYALVTRAGEPVTLFDCGPGSIRALGAAGIGLGDVQRVVISHFHPDHCLDLFALAFARGNPAFEKTPLELIGPPGLRELIANPPRLLARHLPLDDASVVEVEPSKNVQRLEREGAVFSWVENGHTTPSLSWRVDLPGGASLAYTGDTREVPEVANLARGVELFVAECSFNDPVAGEARSSGADKHLTPSGAARLASAAGCQRLLLTHFYPEVDPARAAERAALTFAGRIELARDGSRHALYGAPTAGAETEAPTRR